MEKKTIAILAIAAAGTAALGACIAKCASSDKDEEMKSKGVEPIDFDDDEDDDDWDDDLDDDWDDDDDLWDGEWDDLGGSTETEEDRDRIYENAASNIQRALKKYDVSAKDKDAPAVAVDMVNSYCKALSNSGTKSLNIEITFGDRDRDPDNYSKVRYGANDNEGDE